MTSPRTPSQILQTYGNELATKWGPNVLQNPVANRSSNLVRLLSMTALSLSDIEQKVQALIIEQNPNNLEGLALTSYGENRGEPRNTGTRSKAVIMVTGQQGSTLVQGSELVDRFGAVWRTIADITLDSVGAGCAYAMGIACADDVGAQCLNEGELVYDNTTTPFIFAATNGIMLEIGGAIESDEAYRDRIQQRGPLSRVVGTADYALAQLRKIDGVNFARFVNVNTCIGNGPMFIVHGGADADICDGLLRDSGVVCNMVGEVSCGDCTGIRFQRPCPVLLELEITLTCDCPTQTQESIRSLILSIASRITTQQRLRANDIAVISSEIDSVRFRLKKPKLTTLECDPTVLELLDPIDNSVIKFATNKPFGLCKPAAACEEEEPYVNAINIQPWQYFVLDQRFISFADCVEADGDCNRC